MAGLQLARIQLKGLGPFRLDALEDQCCRHHTRSYGACGRDRTPGGCSALLEGHQRDPSSDAVVINDVLSYGTVHVADVLYDKQSLS
jgi:hypothetical protein